MPQLILGHYEKTRKIDFSSVVISSRTKVTLNPTEQQKYQRSLVFYTVE